VLKCLEAGVAGIIAPQIETADQAEALVEYMRYAPLGNRGVSLSRPHTGFRKVSSREYMDDANNSLVLILQVESRKGLENIGQLTSAPGVDAILIGPNDLAQSLSGGGSSDSDAVDAAIGRIIAATHDRGLVCGIHCSALERVLYWKTYGLKMLMWSSEIALMSAMATKGLAQIREAK
jgi:2-dehydro-3-deoxyglucarate aldolase/4-hydroxy-2-oxoheptanedioate aldolase